MGKQGIEFEKGGYMADLKKRWKMPWKSQISGILLVKKLMVKTYN
jgi:hypothetical protein